jgi:hypothetical protein
MTSLVFETESDSITNTANLLEESLTFLAVVKKNDLFVGFQRQSDF